MSDAVRDAVESYSAGRYREAAAKFRTLTHAVGGADVALMHEWLGRCLYRMSRFLDAALAGEAALRIDPRLAMSQVLVAEGFVARGRLAEGEAALLRAAELDPALDWAYEALGLLYSRSRRYSDAQSALGRAIELRPDLPHLRRELAGVLSSQGCRADALAVLLHAANDFPEDTKTRLALGYAFLWIRALAEAKTQFQEAYRLHGGWLAAFGIVGTEVLVHPWPVGLLFSLVLLVGYLFRGTCALPATAAVSGFFVVGGVVELRAGSRQKGVGWLLMAAFLIGLYAAILHL